MSTDVVATRMWFRAGVGTSCSVHSPPPHLFTHTISPGLVHRASHLTPAEHLRVGEVLNAPDHRRLPAAEP